jgi:Carboxypeptidase regulatory-like domain
MTTLTLKLLLYPHQSKQQGFSQYSWHKPAGIKVCLTDSNTTLRNLTTGLGGTASMDVAEEEQYELSLPDLPEFVCEPSNFTVPKDQQTQTVEVRVYPGQDRWLVPLRLTVKPVGQSTGVAVTGENVRLCGKGGIPPLDFTSMDDGSVYGAWPAGEVRVEAKKTAQLTPVQPDFMMSSGQAQDWTSVQYEAIPARISIRPELKPFGIENAISGVTFELSLPGQEVPLRQTTQGSQAVVFSDLAPGWVKVRAILPTEYGGSPIALIRKKNEVSIKLMPDDDQDLSRYFRFRYETGSLRGRVVDSVGRPLSGVTVVAQSNGLAKTASSNKKGRYVLRKLRVGAWTVMLDKAVVIADDGRTFTAQQAQTSVSVQVGAGKTAKADDFMLELDEHGIRGQVTDGSGNPVPYAVVEIRDQQMKVIDTVVANAQGNYEWKSPSSGMFIVSLLQQDGQTVQRQVVTVNSWNTQNLTSPNLSAPATAPSRGPAPTPDGSAPSTPPSGRIPHEAITDLSAYPVLTEEISTTGVPAPVAGGTGSRGAGAGYGQTVDQVMRDVLGWRPSGDVAGFQAALSGAFQLRQVEGHTEWMWQQRGYAVQADMGALTGAQASIYARAKSALDQILPLLAGLTTINPALYPPQDLEAIRTIVTAELNELVSELAWEGGPRIQRVDELFGLLLGENHRSFSLDPDRVEGQLGILRDRFGLTEDEIDTVDEERIVTNFRVIVEQVLALQASWFKDRELLSGVNARTSLGTLLIWLSRGLEAVCESVDDLLFALDSVYVDAAQRQVIELRFANVTVEIPQLPLTSRTGSTRTTPYTFPTHEPPILLSDLLDWVTRASRDEGPRIVQDAGKDGVLAFAPVLDRLRILVHATRQTARTGVALPDGMRTPRVSRAIQVLAAQLDEAANLARLVRREPLPLITQASASSWDVDLSGPNPITVTLTGSNFRKSDSAVLIAENREDLADLPAQSFTVTPPNNATATFMNPALLRNTAGTTWLLTLTNEYGTQSNQVEVVHVPRSAA